MAAFSVQYALFLISIIKLYLIHILSPDPTGTIRSLYVVLDLLIGSKYWKYIQVKGQLFWGAWKIFILEKESSNIPGACHFWFVDYRKPVSHSGGNKTFTNQTLLATAGKCRMQHWWGFATNKGEKVRIYCFDIDFNHSFSHLSPARPPTKSLKYRFTITILISAILPSPSYSTWETVYRKIWFCQTQKAIYDANDQWLQFDIFVFCILQSTLPCPHIL